MNEYPRLWKNLLNSETGMPMVVKSVQRIMDASYHPNKISIHDEFELVYMQEIEKGTFFINDTAVNVKTNDLLLIKPQVPHYLKIECDKPCRFLFLKFRFVKADETKYSKIILNDFLSFITESTHTEGYFIISNIYCSNIASLMQQIMHESKENDDESEFLCSLLTMQLFVWLSRSLRAEWESTLTSKTHKLQEILESAKAYIEDHYSSDISLSDIAGYVYLSESHFSRAFKKHYQTSPIQYLLKHRIEKAKMLLTETDEKICDIAASVGFGAQQRFNDIFKKNVGVSPGNYRQDFRNSILNK